MDWLVLTAQILGFGVMLLFLLLGLLIFLAVLIWMWDEIKNFLRSFGIELDFKTQDKGYCPSCEKKFYTDPMGQLVGCDKMQKKI